MPNPRRKLSRSKRDKRRANWFNKLKSSQLIECSHCGEKKIPHHACPNCGYYKGNQVYTPESGT